MRFMMLMIPKVYQPGNGAAQTSSAEMVRKMMKYNEELAKAGALLALDGLQQAATRVSFTRGQPVTSEQASAASREVLGGYWLIRANSKEEAVAWARRVPAQDGDVIEVRQVFETQDFPPEARQAAESPIVQARLQEAAKG
jgi:hypothetical protein